MSYYTTTNKAQKGLCRYKHIFGKEREGVHAIRLFDIAILDVIGTIVFAWLFSRLTGIGIVWSILGFFIVAIAIHRLFCVNTKLNVILFGQV